MSSSAATSSSHVKSVDEVGLGAYTPEQIAEANALPQRDPTSLAWQMYSQFGPYIIRESNPITGEMLSHSALAPILNEWSQRLRARGETQLADILLNALPGITLHPYDERPTYPIIRSFAHPNSSIPDEELKEILAKLQVEMMVRPSADPNDDAEEVAAEEELVANMSQKEMDRQIRGDDLVSPAAMEAFYKSGGSLADFLPKPKSKPTK